VNTEIVTSHQSRWWWDRLQPQQKEEDVMGFAVAIKSFWSNYATFKGRARRSEYWFIQLFLVLTNLAVAAIDLALMNGDVDRFIANGGGGIVGLIWILVTIVPALAVLVRRLHDIGRSAWWLLIGLVPFVGTVVLFVFTVFDSTPGQGKYGPPPKA
jgi:uncharacterized membrane protein YhaH (DUF805 family)